jgi:HPt (histidine-containing phosphotransfer) domain-containing protein
MARLRAQYRTRLERDGEALGSAQAAGDRAALLRIAHGLAGSAGTFGYPRISEAAHEAEEALDSGGSDSDLGALIRRIHREIAAALKA